jgi:F-type H+-transporting ATPase subunit epsilon
VAQLEVHVVSPERRLWRGAAEYVSAPAVDGGIGILPGHSPILTLLGEGTVRVDPPGGKKLEFVVSSGILSVDSDVVTVLVHPDL